MSHKSIILLINLQNHGMDITLLVTSGGKFLEEINLIF